MTFAQQPDRAFAQEIRQFAEAAEPGSSTEIFNGKDLSGWEAHGLGQWQVNDGVLSVRRGLGYLSTRYDQFDDFELTLAIRINDEGNSGVYFRSRHPGIGLHPYPRGYEAQVDNHDPKNPTGSLYNRVGVDMGLAQDNDWFEMTIKTVGQNIQIAVNDALVVDATDDTFTSGFIALQAHDFGSVIEFRDIVLTIPEEAEQN